MKKRFIFLFIFFIIVFYVITLSFKKTPQQKSQPQEPLPTPIIVSQQNAILNAYKISSLEKTVIQQTTDEQIISSFNVQSSVSSRSGIKTYFLSSVNPLSPDEIKTQNGKTIFEKTSTFTTSPGGTPSLQVVLSSFGIPEEVLQGNKFFGDFANSYLYPSKGFVIIANPNTSEIYEILHFTPMAHQQFDILYGVYVEALAPHKH